MKPLIILSGPTAVGKTSTSIELAKRINGEIISADSMQVYKGMDIGTAKITVDEMQGVPHYLIDIMEPTEEFNVFVFKEKAKQAIEEIYSKGKIPIIVGGTGFYIQAIVYDIEFSQEENDFSYRKKLESLAEEKGADYLFDELRKVDEKSTEVIHKNNIKRVIRALEYYHITGLPISSHNEEQRQKTSPYNYGYFVLTNDRDILYDRINKRVDIMVNAGLLEEVKKLLQKGYAKNLVSMQGIGYKEVIEHIEGNCTYEEAVENIKLNTRHFAKRQLTWFKREKDVDMINVKNYKNASEVCDYIINTLESKHILKGNNLNENTGNI